MKTRRRNLAITSVMILTALYVTAPVVAGYYDHGDRRGPRIYPSEIHYVLFRIGFHLGEQPGSPVVPNQKRPWFY